MQATGLRRNHDACKEQPSTAMALGMHQVRPHRNYEGMKRIGSYRGTKPLKWFCGKWYGVKIMTILRIEHAVRNFDAWKKTFDSDPLGRKKSGVRRYRILRPTDNPNYVMIDLKFDGSGKAETFRTALRSMWHSPDAQKIMENPQLRIVEEVGSKEYRLLDILVSIPSHFQTLARLFGELLKCLTNSGLDCSSRFVLNNVSA